MSDDEPRGLVCFSTTAASAYIDGLEKAISLIAEYDATWGTTDLGHGDHIRHQIQMFRSNWESRNQIVLPSSQFQAHQLVPPARPA